MNEVKESVESGNQKWRLQSVICSNHVNPGEFLHFKTPCELSRKLLSNITGFANL